VTNKMSNATEALNNHWRECSMGKQAMQKDLLGSVLVVGRNSEREKKSSSFQNS